MAYKQAPEELKTTLARERSPLNVSSRSALEISDQPNQVIKSSSHEQQAIKEHVELFSNLVDVDTFKFSKNHRELEERKDDLTVADFESTLGTLQKQYDYGGSKEADLKKKFHQNDKKQQFRDKLERDFEKHNKNMARKHQKKLDAKDQPQLSCWFLCILLGFFGIMVYLIYVLFGLMFD